MSVPRPYTLIAELTYRCPLKCPYCSNPTNLKDHDGELTTEDWKRVLGEAEELGVVQVHFTGGEPCSRKDLEELVARARELELYSNLVTSGVPMSRERLAGLAARGLDHVQVSIQSARQARSDEIAGFAGYPQKLEVMRWVRELGLPLTINVVLHRANLDEIDELVAMAEEYDASRLELANTQYVAWALKNREQLMPSREQLEAAANKAYAHKKRLEGKVGSSRVDLQACKLEYSIVSPK